MLHKYGCASRYEGDPRLGCKSGVDVESAITKRVDEEGTPKYCIYVMATIFAKGEK